MVMTHPVLKRAKKEWNLAIILNEIILKTKIYIAFILKTTACSKRLTNYGFTEIKKHTLEWVNSNTLINFNMQKRNLRLGYIQDMQKKDFFTVCYISGYMAYKYWLNFQRIIWKVYLLIFINQNPNWF